MSTQPTSSLDFYSMPSQTSKTVLLAIVMIIALILIIALVLILASRIKKPCTGAPSPPTNIEAGFVDSKTFRVRWTPVKDVSDYTVYVGQTVDFTRAQSVKSVKTNKSSADITGLDANKIYYIFVTATNACGESAESDRIIFIFIAT